MYNNTNNFGKMVPFFMWLIPLMFFSYQFILRLWPGLMMQQIMRQLSIDASSFGALAASYYYGYALMQIPVAILLDRYGARIILCFFAILCGVASIVFFYTHNYYIALGSRFLIGAGSAVGFLGVSKVSSEWFDRSSYAKMIGLSFSFGLTGAIFGGKPVSILMEKYSSENVALMLGFVSIAIGIFAFLFLRSAKSGIVLLEAQFNLSGFRSVMKSKTIWMLGLINALLVGSLEGFADVWGVMYLMSAYSIKKNDAAFLISFIFFGMLVGGPMLAWLNEKIKEYKTIFVAGAIMSAILTMLLLNFISYHGLYIAFFIIGIACCYQVVIFTLGSKMVAYQNIGICVAFLNSINMLGGSFHHTAIGIRMDKFWRGMLDISGERLYDLNAYKYALSIIPINAAIGSILIIALLVINQKILRQKAGNYTPIA